MVSPTLLPTDNAPKTLDDLKQLLKDDIKVKVAGKSQSVS